MSKAEQEFIESRRQFLVRALSLGYLAGGAGWSLPAMASWFGTIPGKLPENRSVFEMKGEVMVNGKPANEKTLITPADKITTGHDSYLIAAVGANAFIVRDKSILDLGGANPLKQAFRLVTGKFLGVFGKLAGNQSLSIHTPAATIGIRGTGVYAESDPDKTYLCTCYGTTELVAKADYEPVDPEAAGKSKKKGRADSAAEPEPEMTRVTAKHHDAPKYILANAEKGKKITPAPFINHTDLELMTLEALVGRKVPFGLPDSQYEGPRREY